MLKGNAVHVMQCFLCVFQVIITFRIAWRRSYDSYTFCDQSTITSGQLIGVSGYLQCQDGCSGNLGNLYFRCTDFSTTEDWTTGTNSFQYTFPISILSRRYYQVRYITASIGTYPQWNSQNGWSWKIRQRIKNLH